MATHSSTLAWRIPGMAEPGGLPSMGSQRVRHDWSDLAAAASANSDRYTSSFWIYIPFISFTTLIAVVRTSKTILNKSNKSGPCLFPNLRGNDFCFSQLSIIFTVSLWYMAFIMLRDVPSLPIFLRVFIINGCWIF